MSTINSRYKLNKIFTEEYFYKKLPKSPVLKITNIQDLLYHYKEQIDNQAESVKFLNFKSEQIYTAEFFFDDDEYYKISWNIAKAKHIIAENKVPAGKMELKKLSDSLFEKDININHLKVAKHNSDPIIVAAY